MKQYSYFPINPITMVIIIIPLQLHLIEKESFDCFPMASFIPIPTLIISLQQFSYYYMHQFFFLYHDQNNLFPLEILRICILHILFSTNDRTNSRREQQLLHDRYYTDELPPEELACCAICNDGEWIEGVDLFTHLLICRIRLYFVMVVILEFTLHVLEVL